ncbi:hypothetical protein [Methanogenium cariaci]|jgi:hypothetical protein
MKSHIIRNIEESKGEHDSLILNIDPAANDETTDLRERALLREFDGHTGETKRLKVFRIEAIRAGFKKAWQEKDYRIIIAVAKRIPPKVLEEDPKLLMCYDQAVTRVGE